MKIKSKKSIKKSIKKPRRFKMKGGFKEGEVNELGNSGAIITSCISCCGQECFPVRRDGSVTTVSKVFPSTAKGISAYMQEIQFGPMLFRIDPNQDRFVYNLRQTCEECREIPLGELPESVFKVLRKVNPDSTRDTLLSSFYMYSMPALEPYENVTLLSEARKNFLRESVQILHANGICHNDLHKYNILQGLDYNPRIIDFGNSTTFDPRNPTEEDRERMSNEMRYLENTLRHAPPEIPRSRHRRLPLTEVKPKVRSRSRSRSRSLSPSRFRRLQHDENEDAELDALKARNPSQFESPSRRR
jgi:serine/threonine protein kinase